jgi:two-component system cell cycle response regulator CtrA
MTSVAIDSLRLHAGRANELQRLRDRCDELEELLGIKCDPLLSLGFPKLATSMLGVLMANPRCRREMLYVAVYGNRSECDQPNEKIVAVAVCKLRKELRPHGADIVTDWGVGYFIPPASKDVINRLVAAGTVVHARQNRRRPA